ncbi:unnamed protein product [Lepidochelys kempii]
MLPPGFSPRPRRPWPSQRCLRQRRCGPAGFGLPSQPSPSAPWRPVGRRARRWGGFSLAPRWRGSAANAMQVLGLLRQAPYRPASPASTASTSQGLHGARPAGPAAASSTGRREAPAAPGFCGQERSRAEQIRSRTLYLPRPALELLPLIRRREEQLSVPSNPLLPPPPPTLLPVSSPAKPARSCCSPGTHHEGGDEKEPRKQLAFSAFLVARSRWVESQEKNGNTNRIRV